MSFSSVFDIAGSALSAQSLRLNVTASNLANADSASSSAGATYRARQPVFAAAYRDALGVAVNGPGSSALASVTVRGIVESQAPLRSQYSPGHPLADKDGYLHLPNVNIVEEMANMISASRSYQSNVEVINTSKQLLQRTLTLGQ
ncbi:MAG: flagellar basal body rod protein FlgC [Gammaproteobacteria bacterium]|nr:flagellar basal body rod protein FlgC [Gammaproteobacteria bacterium]